MYNYSKHGKFGQHRHGFSVWPLLLLALIAFVFAGPILSLTFFVVKLAIGLLPFALMFGLGVWFARHKWGQGEQGKHWAKWGNWGQWGDWSGKGDWHKPKFDQREAAKPKREPQTEGGSDIFYV